ncbi:MAG: hypothetical protein Q9174_001988 [Haloplaca sp. 1 TL-2023]
MHLSSLFAVLLALPSVIPGSAAWKNNCKGSANYPYWIDCINAKSNIDPKATYTGGEEFSVDTCFMKYRTVKEGEKPVSGAIILDTLKDLESYCKQVFDGQTAIHGSFATGSCKSCHITVDYRNLDF